MPENEPPKCQHHWILGELVEVDQREGRGMGGWKYVNLRKGKCKKCGEERLHREREYPPPLSGSWSTDL